jgi:hypothetical protein
MADLIARRVIEVIRSELRTQLDDEDWIDSKEVARRFSLSRAWVYANAPRLGVVKVGDGARPRLRFIPSVVAKALREGATHHAEPVESEVVPELGLPIHVPRVRSRRSNA